MGRNPKSSRQKWLTEKGEIMIMKWTDVPSGQVNAAIQRLMSALGNNAGDVIECINNDPDFVISLADTAVGVALTKKNQTYNKVGAILGRDFISPEEIMHLFGVYSMNQPRKIKYSLKQLNKLFSTIPDNEKLNWCRSNNCILIPGPDCTMSLQDIRNLKLQHFRYQESKEWYRDENFTKVDTVGMKWYIVSKSFVKDSQSKKYEEQVLLLSNDEYVPNVAEIVWAMISYKEIRGKELFESMYVRTSSLTSNNKRVAVSFTGHNIEIIEDESLNRTTALIIKD